MPIFNPGDPQTMASALSGGIPGVPGANTPPPPRPGIGWAMQPSQQNLPAMQNQAQQVYNQNLLNQMPNQQPMATQGLGQPRAADINAMPPRPMPPPQNPNVGAIQGLMGVDPARLEAIRNMNRWR